LDDADLVEQNGFRPTMRLRCLLLAIAVCAFLPATVVHADTFYVAVDGSDQSGTGAANRPYASIAHAVNEGIPAGGGATVVVRDGSYSGLTTLQRGFPRPVLIRSEHPYRAILANVDGGAEVIRVYVRGPARITIEGFVLTNYHPTYPCDGGREANYLIHLQDASGVTLQDNIIFGNNAPGTCNELLKINRSDAAYYPKDILIRGNVFTGPANAGGADMIDSVRPGEIDIVDNIFFANPAHDRSQSFITLKRQAPAEAARSPRYRVARNVFLNWGGQADQAFVQFGEDGVAEYEITDALVENNLFIGNSPARLAAPLQLKGVRGVTVRANTVVGDLPGGAYGLRIGTEGDNPRLGEIRVINNIWSDPSGTMGQRFINTYGDVDLASIALDHNLFWNAGNPLPSQGAAPPDADANRVVADPRLNADQAAIVLPQWNAAAGQFLSGAGTIRAEFLRLVETYGAPGAGSPAIDAADPGAMPADDIRGGPRDARPDLGAFEYDAGVESSTPSPTLPPTSTPAAPPTATVDAPRPTVTPGVTDRQIYLPCAGPGRGDGLRGSVLHRRGLPQDNRHAQPQEYRGSRVEVSTDEEDTAAPVMTGEVVTPPWSRGR
jgi:hypothetical protein